jgi:cytochrome c2
MATATYPGGARPGSLAAGPVSPETGKQLMVSKGCVACHKAPDVPGAVGEVGPDLTGVGDTSKRPQIAGGTLTNSPENMKRWLANPPAVKPGTQMPNLNLTPREMDSLVAFLQTLK